MTRIKSERSEIKSVPTSEIDFDEMQRTNDAIYSILEGKASKNLRYFIPFYWNTFVGTPFVGNWHIDCIAEHVQAAYERQIRRLIITVPPRSSKSSVVSACAPAFRWITNPEEKFLTASHSLKLGKDNLMLVRKILTSDLYRKKYCIEGSPDFSFKISEEQNTKTNMENTMMGKIEIGSPESAVLGAGATVLMVDDIIDMIKIRNAQSRKEVNEWVTKTFFNRSNDKNEDIKIIICQRLHEDDIVGHLHNEFRGEKGFFELRIPAEFERQLTFISPLGKKWNDPRKKEGELMDAKRLPIDFLESQDSITRATLFQQNPKAQKLGIAVTPSDIKYVNYLPIHFDNKIIMWDLTFGASQASNSWNMGLLVGKAGDNYYIIDFLRAKLDIMGQLDAIRKMSKKYPDAEIGVEMRANGEAVYAMLKQEFPKMIPFKPSEWGKNTNQDKEERFGAVIRYWKGGQVYIYKPLTPNYNLEDSYDPEHFAGEITGFPLAATDEGVDCSSYAIGYLARNNGVTALMIMGDAKLELTTEDSWEKHSAGSLSDVNGYASFHIFTEEGHLPSFDDIMKLDF